MTKGNIVTLKDELWLKRQVYAGKVVAKAHQGFYAMLRGRATKLTLKDLESFAHELILKNNCIPTFLNYRGFPSVICASLNKEIVHGFGTRDIELKDGDVLKIDIGATFEGAIADCAVTYVYGKCKNDNVLKMLISCQDTLTDAINVVKPGSRIGDIGKVIWDRSKLYGFGVITEFGGHGIDYNTLHAPPFVPNKAKSDEGLTIQPGMSIAIEPMFVLGNNTNTKLLNDKWTVITKDVGCHYEHSISLDKDGNRYIITEHGISARDFV